jgi:hypothetical protein
MLMLLSIAQCLFVLPPAGSWFACQVLPFAKSASRMPRPTGKMILRCRFRRVSTFDFTRAIFFPIWVASFGHQSSSVKTAATDSAIDVSSQARTAGLASFSYCLIFLMRLLMWPCFSRL